MTEIAIIGGGIGGLCTAIGLLDRGFDLVVYEATNELRPVGSGITIPPNGMEALSRLGVADSIAEEGTTIDQTELRTPDGASFMSMDFQAQAEQLGLNHASVTIHRGDLQGILSDRLPADVIQLGKECVGVDPFSPTVQFASGEEIEPELIVGADGAGSAVRDSLFPETELRYADEIAYRGLAETTLPDEMSHTGAEIWGSGERFGCFPLNDRVYWFATMVASAPDDIPEMTPTDLANRFREFSAPIPDLISMTDETDLVRTPLMDLQALDTWNRGNATLLGDAAHAMTPNLAQGSAQAMEDAVVLAQSVAESQRFGVWMSTNHLIADRLVISICGTVLR